MHFSIILFLLLIFSPYYVECKSVKRIMTEFKQFKLQMKGYSPTRTDDYVAISYKAEPGYIVKFEPFASAQRVHHMLLYGCQAPASSESFWRGGQTCSGSTHILYAWARNAPSLTLPKNVAFSVGNEGDTVRYFVLQIHYAKPFRGNVRDFSGVTLHLSDKRPKYLADVMLFVSGQPIPPRQPAFLNNMSCTYDSEVQLHPFAFRTHTHAMGRVVSAYVRHEEAAGGAAAWRRIGKRNPQWPQLFESVEDKDLVIRKGDFMAATCRFDSSDKDRAVPMGSMGVDEMCNFYMMYYRDADASDPYPYGAFCGGNENPTLVDSEYPADGTTLLPDHPEWEHTAHQSALPFGVTEKAKITQIGDVKLGQVSGLAFDNRGRIAVFHRAETTWSYATFDAANTLTDKTPIASHTILVGQFDETSKDVKLVAKYGKSLFYLPHSVFVDESNYYYTTDVGSHQVIKWEIVNGELHPIWKLGEQFVPGDDTAHFCKPAGVAVSRVDGNVFVADGYCNSRVMKFSNDGRFIAEWGRPTHGGREFGGGNLGLGFFSLPHDVTLDERDGRVFVADRENGRVQAFTEHGDPLFNVSDPTFYRTVYSTHYSDEHGLLFIPGPSPSIAELDAYVVPQNATQIEYSFRPITANFERPHIIRALGNAVWVGEIAETGGVLWRLQVEAEEMGAGGAHKHAKMMSDSGHAGHANALFEGKLKDFASGQEVVREHFWTTLFLALVFISGFYAFCYYCVCRQKCGDLLAKCWPKRKGNSAQSSIDRKGFQPLRNLDDDDDEEEDPDSDEDFRPTSKPHLLKG